MFLPADRSALVQLSLQDWCEILDCLHGSDVPRTRRLAVEGRLRCQLQPEFDRLRLM